jgi:3-oxoacyl-ACP reductase-like protein
MDGIDVSEQTNQSPVEEAVPGGAPVEAAASPAAVAEAPSENGGVAEAPAVAVAATDDSELDAASLMEQFLNDPSHDYKSLKYGDVMDGVIMHLDREEILVDIGSKSEGIVPSREYSSLTQEERQALARKRAGAGCRSCTRRTRSSRPKSPITTRAVCW